MQRRNFRIGVDADGQQLLVRHAVKRIERFVDDLNRCFKRNPTLLFKAREINVVATLPRADVRAETSDLGVDTSAIGVVCGGLWHLVSYVAQVLLSRRNVPHFRAKAYHDVESE